MSGVFVVNFALSIVKLYSVVFSNLKMLIGMLRGYSANPMTVIFYVFWGLFVSFKGMLVVLSCDCRTEFDLSGFLVYRPSNCSFSNVALEMQLFPA